MGANDDREMLESAKAEVVRLERIIAEAKKATERSQWYKLRGILGNV